MEYLKLIKIKDVSKRILNLIRIGNIELLKVISIDYPTIHNNRQSDTISMVDFIDENGEVKSMEFEEGDMVGNRPLAYDEPWYYEWATDVMSLNQSEKDLLVNTEYESATHKYYGFPVSYFGHPDTHLEIAEFETDEFDVYYTTR